MDRKIAVVIVAAGRGTRLGGPVPKQYIPLDGSPALRRSVEAFLQRLDIAHVLPVIGPDDDALCADALGDVTDPRLLPPVTGGATRAASVRRGLERLAPLGPSHVLIHDAARPFVSQAVIARVIDGLRTYNGVCAAMPVVDALWRGPDGHADSPIPRDGIWRAQTPQGFLFTAILDAHKAHDGNGADDVAVAREAGLPVRFVEGSEQNYKITTEADLERALTDLRGARTD